MTRKHLKDKNERCQKKIFSRKKKERCQKKNEINVSFRSVLVGKNCLVKNQK